MVACTAYKAEACGAQPCSQQQQQQEDQQQPQPPPAPKPAHSAPAAAPSLRRASHPALKRRSTGLGARGLSRNYSGKSQSFCCIQDLARNPWAANTALALAKRHPSASPGDPPSLLLPPSWSIDEEDEIVLGGVTLAARLAPGSCSSASASAGGAAGSSSSMSDGGGCGDGDDDSDIGTDEDADSTAGCAAPVEASLWPGAPLATAPLACGAAAAATRDAAGSAASSAGGSLADELTAAMEGARLSPPPPAACGLWFAAAALLGGAGSA